METPEGGVRKNSEGGFWITKWVLNLKFFLSHHTHQTFRFIVLEFKNYEDDEKLGKSLLHLVQPGDEGALDFFPPVRILDCFEAAITINRHRES